MCARPKRAPFEASTAARVLAFLRAGEGRHVSGQWICRELGLSRVAVWKHVNTLREQGCRIAACRHLGYRLLAVPDLPTEDVVAGKLRTRTIGRPLVFFREIDSTNRQLAQRAAAGAAEGLVVVADYQSAGRGRMERDWFSPVGANLYFSVLLRPPVEPARMPTLPLMLGCAVARALRHAVPDLPVCLKWPNDLYVKGRKLGGILCEMQSETDRVGHVVAGIGLNVNLRAARLPARLRRTATSLTIATGRTFSRTDLLAAVLNEIEDAYRVWCVKGLKPFLAEIAAADALKGRAVRIEQTGRTLQGVADGVLADGTLRVRLRDGSCTTVCSGDAHLGAIPRARRG